jgi:CRP-like cAMP-binding protein
MLRLIHQDEGVCDAIISSLVSLKTDIIGSYADNLLYFAQQRLARLLLKMGRSDEDPEIGRVPKLRQQDLANMIGVSRQRVNLLLKALKKAGPLIDDSGFRKD